MNTNSSISKTVITAYLKAVERRKTAEAAEAEAKAALIAALNGAESVVAHGYVVSNKRVVSNRVDTTALKAAEPETAARFTVVVESTRFNVKVSK